MAIADTDPCRWCGGVHASGLERLTMHRDADLLTLAGLDPKDQDNAQRIFWLREQIKALGPLIAAERRRQRIIKATPPRLPIGIDRLTRRHKGGKTRTYYRARIFKDGKTIKLPGYHETVEEAQAHRAAHIAEHIA